MITFYYFYRDKFCNGNYRKNIFTFYRMFFKYPVKRQLCTLKQAFTGELFKD